MGKRNLDYFLWKRWPWFAVKRHGLRNNNVLKDAEFMEAYLLLISEGRILISLREMHNIYSQVLRCKNLEGDMAEVGVFQGGSAKLISMFKGNAPLHLFDTFAGMPTTDQTKDKHQVGDFADTTLEQVQAYLAKYPRILYHKGYFPATVDSEIASRTFSFVHLDADIYQSTLDGLNFFYPRLTSGGVIISHDYSSHGCDGVKAAFDLFCAKNNVVALPLWDTQCLLMKGPPAGPVTAQIAER